MCATNRRGICRHEEEVGPTNHTNHANADSHIRVIRVFVNSVFMAGACEELKLPAQPGSGQTPKISSMCVTFA